MTTRGPRKGPCAPAKSKRGNAIKPETELRNERTVRLPFGLMRHDLDESTSSSLLYYYEVCLELMCVEKTCLFPLMKLVRICAARRPAAVAPKALPLEGGPRPAYSR